jgi:hypothetical protein
MDQLRFDVTRCYSQGREQQSGVKAMSNLCTRELKFCDDDGDDGKSRCSNKQHNYNTINEKVTITSMKCMFGMFSSERE